MYFENLDCFGIVIRSKFLSVESDRNSKNSHHTKLLYGRSWTEKRRSCTCICVTSSVTALEKWKISSQSYSSFIQKRMFILTSKISTSCRITPLEIHIRIFHENASFSKISFSIVIHEFVDANLYNSDNWNLSYSRPSLILINFRTRITSIRQCEMSVSHPLVSLSLRR